MRIVNTKEMKELETLAEQEFGLTERLIIENVGLHGAEFLFEKYLNDTHYGELVFFIGKGNNGADGLAIARHLRRFGYAVRAFLLFPKEELSQELTHQLLMAEAYGVKISKVKTHEEIEGYFSQTQSEYFVVDAIFGTGVRLPLANLIFNVIRSIEKFSTITVSVDIPTGVCGDTGRMEGNAISADTTLSIGIPKIGYYIGDGPEHTGSLKVIDAGFPNELLKVGNKTLLTSSFVAHLARKRDQFAHKNVFGHTVLIGGSTGLTGALVLASNAALRVGSGLITSITWQKNYSELVAQKLPEIITGYIPEDDEVLKNRLDYLERANALVIGPGLGRKDESRAAVLKVLENYSGPIVIDADAINVLSLKDDKELLNGRKAPTIFTPHLGEFSRFMGADKNKAQEDILSYLKSFIEETNCSVVLKGACSYVGFPNNKLFINYKPNSGMATGGSGDVLAGLIGGLFAQIPYDPETSDPLSELEKFYSATCLGVVLHSKAGEFAANHLGERAMVASSITDYLTEAFFEIDKKGERYAYEEQVFDEGMP